MRDMEDKPEGPITPGNGASRSRVEAAVALRALRSLAAGGVATLIDVATLALMTGALGLPATAANVPALAAGAAAQFVLQRRFAFRARAGSLPRQVTLFVMAEAITLVLNAWLFHVVAASLRPGPAGAIALRGLVTAAVFACWTFPVLHVVFLPTGRGAGGRDECGR